MTMFRISTRFLDKLLEEWALTVPFRTRLSKTSLRYFIMPLVYCDDKNSVATFPPTLILYFNCIKNLILPINPAILHLPDFTLFSHL